RTSVWPSEFAAISFHYAAASVALQQLHAGALRFRTKLIRINPAARQGLSGTPDRRSLDFVIFKLACHGYLVFSERRKLSLRKITSARVRDVNGASFVFRTIDKAEHAVRQFPFVKKVTDDHYSRFRWGGRQQIAVSGFEGYGIGGRIHGAGGERQPVDVG